MEAMSCGGRIAQSSRCLRYPYLAAARWNLDDCASATMIFHPFGNFSAGTGFQPLLNWRLQSIVLPLCTSHRVLAPHRSTRQLRVRNQRIINEIQKSLDDIQTEATRLMVLAYGVSDAAQAARFKDTAKAIFRAAMAIESLLTLFKPTRSGRRNRPPR